MKARLVFVIGIAIGVGLGVAFAQHKQIRTQPSSKIAPLLGPARMSDLEWRLLEAELSQVKDAANVLTKDGFGSCCASYWYDAGKGKVVGRFVFSPKTLNSLSIEEARNRLHGAAVTAVSEIEVEFERGPTTVKVDTDKDFEIQFATWDEHAQLKQFAIFRNGDIELSDGPLK